MPDNTFLLLRQQHLPETLYNTPYHSIRYICHWFCCQCYKSQNLYAWNRQGARSSVSALFCFRLWYRKFRISGLILHINYSCVFSVYPLSFFNPTSVPIRDRLMFIVCLLYFTNVFIALRKRSIKSQPFNSDSLHSASPSIRSEGSLSTNSIIIISFILIGSQPKFTLLFLLISYKKKCATDLSVAHSLIFWIVLYSVFEMKRN